MSCGTGYTATCPASGCTDSACTRRRAPTSPPRSPAEFGTKKVYETSRYAASADATRLVTASNYHLFLFDTTGPMKQLASRQLPDRSNAQVVSDVATSADAGLTAATLFGGGTDRKSVWLMSGSKLAVVTPVPMPADPTAVAVDPAGGWVAIGCGNGSAAIVDPSGRRVTQLLDPHGREHYHSDLAVSPDGSLLAWANGQGTVHVWDTADWSARPAIRDRADGVSFDPLGRCVITTLHYTHLPPKAMRARERLARVFDAATGQLVRDVAVPGFCIARAVFSPGGRRIACALKVDSKKWAGVDEVALVNGESGRMLDRLKANFESVNDLAFLPHRGEIAVAVFGHTRRPLVLWKPKGLEGEPV